MATYTIKTFNQSKVLQEEGKNNFKWFISLPFTVVELNHSDNIILSEEDFTLPKGWHNIKNLPLKFRW